MMGAMNENDAPFTLNVHKKRSTLVSFHEEVAAVPCDVEFFREGYVQLGLNRFLEKASLHGIRQGFKFLFGFIRDVVELGNEGFSAVSVGFNPVGELGHIPVC